MLAIIGGTGVYRMEGLRSAREFEVVTPFGTPSAKLVRGRFGAHDVLFLARHGEAHALLPHEINYRANIFALKLLGATQIIGVSAVGSLREHIAPGDLALPTQYLDWTRGMRQSSFFGGGVSAHVATANPVSANLSGAIAAQAKRLGMRAHADLTYACVEGPRLGTRAESLFLRQAGCDLVGMTNVPEAFLAREAQICYATIGIATDYDCWMDDPARHVSVDAIFARYGQSLRQVTALLGAMAEQPLPAEEEEIRTALAHAVLTPDSALSPAQLNWLGILRG